MAAMNSEREKHASSRRGQRRARKPDPQPKAAFQASPLFGGFPLIEGLPPGCIAQLVKDDRAEPLLRAREFAVVDPTQRQPIENEIFVIEWETGGRAIVETRAKRADLIKGADGRLAFVRNPDGNDLEWWVGAPHRPRSKDEFDLWLKQGRLRTSDGPYVTEHLASKLIGRVIGVLSGEQALADARARAYVEAVSGDWRCQKCAESFDPAVFVSLWDQTAQVWHVHEGATLSEPIAFMDEAGSRLSGFAELRDFHKTNEDIFRTFSLGGPFAMNVLVDHLRSLHRVVRRRGDRWDADPQMPADVLARLAGWLSEMSPA